MVIDGQDHPAPAGTFTRLDPEPAADRSSTAATATSRISARSEVTRRHLDQGATLSLPARSPTLRGLQMSAAGSSHGRSRIRMSRPTTAPRGARETAAASLVLRPRRARGPSRGGHRGRGALLSSSRPGVDGTSARPDHGDRSHRSAAGVASRSSSSSARSGSSSTQRPSGSSAPSRGGAPLHRAEVQYVSVKQGLRGLSHILLVDWLFVWNREAPDLGRPVERLGRAAGLRAARST